MGQAELEPKDIDVSIAPLHSAIKRTFAAFCSTSSIHGIKYVRDQETNKYVRFIWILIAVVMFTCAISMVITFYVAYRSNPTRLNVENDHAPVESLYFPAVTVCPESPYNADQAKRFIETLKLPPLSSVKDVLDSLYVSYGFFNDDEQFTAQDVRLMQELLVLNNLTLTQFVLRLRWNCKDILFRCRYHYQLTNCDELFQVSRTFHGYCCTFNLNQTNVNFTGHLVRAGLQDGLSLILYYNDSNLDWQNTYSSGFKLLLDQNNVFPSAHAGGKFVGLGAEVFIAIRPVETFCSRAVRALSIEERQCVLPYEHKLPFFQAYVGSNCQLNCRAQNMMKFCGCITYFFDNKLNHSRVCDYADIPCLVDKFGDIVGRFRNTQCSCPTHCEGIEYNIDLTSVPLHLDMPTMDAFYDDIQKEYTVVHVFFNSQIYRRVRRDLLSNMVTLVSNLGSAFSLFVGMSMVSVVEILYYLIVVLWKYYFQELKTREKVSQNANLPPEAANELE